MNKRGAIIEVPWSFLMEIILLAMIVVFLFVQANDVVKNDRFERLFHVRDISLLYNTVGSLSGSVDYSYEMLGKYTINILRGKTELLQLNEESGKGAVYYPFFENTFLEYEYDLITPKKMELRTIFSLQKNDQVMINEQTNFVTESCPVIATQLDDQTIFVFDQGNFFDFVSFVLNYQNQF